MVTLIDAFAGTLAESPVAPVEVPVADAPVTRAESVEREESDVESDVDESVFARVESLRTSGVSRTT
jgi:hypothetical protein